MSLFQPTRNTINKLILINVRISLTRKPQKMSSYSWSNKWFCLIKDFLNNNFRNRQLWSASNQATLLWWKKHWIRRFTKITKIILFPLKGKTTKLLLTQFNPCLFGILLWKTNLNKMKRSLMGWISKMKSNLTSRKLAEERGLKQSLYRLSTTMTPK